RWPLADVVPPTTAAVGAAQQQLRFRESLTLVSVSQAGAATYVGTASYFGHVRAVLYPGNLFTQHAANGDTASGRVTPASATTGAITISGGSRRLPGATGTSPYVLTSTYVVSADRAPGSRPSRSRGRSPSAPRGGRRTTSPPGARIRGSSPSGSPAGGTPPA